jgi:hypothetical protein
MEIQGKPLSQKLLRNAAFETLGGVLKEEARNGKMPLDALKRLVHPRGRETVRRMLRIAECAWKVEELPVYLTEVDLRDIHRSIEERKFFQVDRRIAGMTFPRQEKTVTKRLHLVPPLWNRITMREQQVEMAALGLVPEGIAELVAFKTLSGITATNFVLALGTTVYEHEGSSWSPVYERTSRGCRLVATYVDPDRRWRIREASFLMSSSSSNESTVS